MNAKELKPYFRLSDYRACVNVTYALLTAEEQEVNYTLECTGFEERVLHIWLTNDPNGPMIDFYFPNYHKPYEKYRVSSGAIISDTFYIEREYTDLINMALNTLHGCQNYSADYECDTVGYETDHERLVFSCSAEKYGDILDYLESL